MSQVTKLIEGEKINQVKTIAKTALEQPRTQMIIISKKKPVVMLQKPL
jgi:hypothetical protein